MAGMYERDEEIIREWVEASKTADGAQSYLKKYIYDLPDHAAYLEMMGQERLEKAKVNL
jgi:hypothetical protein